MPGLFDDLPVVGGAKLKALFDDLPDAADPDSFEAQAAQSGLTRREAKGLLLEAEMLGERAFPEQTEDRSTFEKARNQAAGTAARGAASVIEGLKMLAVPPPRTPSARRLFERSASDLRWADPGFLLQNEALMAIGVDPVKTTLMEEIHAPWRQSKHEVDRYLAPIQEPLVERGDAALQVAEATQGNKNMAEVGGAIGSAVPTLLVAPAGPAAAVAVAGLQSGGAVKTEARDAYLALGLPDFVAEQLANDAAVLSGLSTAVVTAGGGSILGRQGIEGWTRAAMVNRLSKVQPIRHVIGEAFKEAGAEGIEESVDQAIQSAIAVRSYRPSLTWQQAIDESLQAGLLGAVSAGVITAPMAAASLSRLSKSQLSRDAARMIEEELSRPLPASVSRTAKVMELERNPLIRDVFPGFEESPVQTRAEDAAKGSGVSSPSTVGSARVEQLVTAPPETEDVPARFVSPESLPPATVTDESESTEQVAGEVQQSEPASQTGVSEPAGNRIETLVMARRSKANMVPVVDFRVGQTFGGTWSYTFQLNGTSSGYGVPWSGKFQSRELAVNGGLMDAYRWLRSTRARRDNSKADLKSLGQIESLLKPLLAKPEQRKPAPWETGAGAAQVSPAPLFADLPSSPSAALVTTVTEPTLSTSNETDTRNAAPVDSGEQFRAVATTGQPAVAAAPGVDEGAPTGAGAEPLDRQSTRRASQPESGAGAGSDPQGQIGGRQRGRGTRVDGRPSDSAAGRIGDKGAGTGAVESRSAEGIAPVGAQPGPQADLTAENHVIGPDDVLAPAGDKAKARANLDAVRLLHTLEAVGRNATPAEKKTLAKYSGWGALKPLFDHAKARYRATEPAWEKAWGKLYDETLKTLTEEEYRSAGRSILNAHYTSREVVDVIWSAARHLGFEGGTVLEPSAGVGNFFGLMPRDLAARSSLHAVELDSVSSRILAKLYPQARVQGTGFETARLPNNSMDLVIGNVPFAKDGPYDPRYPRLSLHNYFFARGLDLVKPGGLMVAITSTSTMDNAASLEARELLAEKADLVGAIRLPNTAFKANAGTEVTTDLLVFRKKDGNAFPLAEPFRDVRPVQVQGGPVLINEYFVRHPEMMLGKMALEGTMYGPNQPALIPNPGEDLRSALLTAVTRLPARVDGSGVKPPTTVDVGVWNERGSKEGQLVVKGGDVAVVESGALVKPDWAGSKPLVEQAKRYVGLRDATKALIEAQLNPATTDDQAAALRQQLNQNYDDYVNRHGPVGARRSAFLEDDPEFPLVRALENIETVVVERTVRSGKGAGQIVARKEERFSKAEIFAKRTMFPRLAPERADTPADALAISLAYKNNADPAYIGQLLGVPADEARNQLLSLGLVFENPQTGVLEAPDAYLSGFVKDKLKAARLAAADNPAYLRNVEALEKVQPEPVPFEGINFRLGSTWIPPQDVQAFIRDVLDVQAEVALVEQTGTWTVRPVAGQSNSKNATTYGGEYAGHELVEEALNLRSPVVYDTWRDAQGEHRERNPAKTLAMQQKQEQLRTLFVQWVRGNAPVARRLHEIYNDNFNGTVLRRYQGPSWDHYPGASSDVVLRPHQKAVVTRNLQHSTLLAHGVGTGKTYVLITTAMEMKRLGLAKKPVIVVQNATLNQVATSFKRLYPASKVLAPSERQREAKNRQRLMSQIATGDWDAVIVPQSWINMVPDDPVRVAGYVQQRLDELESALIEARRDEGARSPKAADLQKAKNRLEKRLAELGDRKKDNVLTFEQLGVDALLVDEAHAYKKLEFTTKMDSVKGLDRGASQRGFGMLMKARFVQERNQGKNVIFATGTPISNTLAEAWNMMRYLRPDVLRQYRMEEFDAFAALFGETVTQMEMTAGGTWKPVSRFARFTNGPELLAAIHTVADVVLGESVSLPGVPAIKNGKPTSVVVRQTPRVAGYIKYLRERLEKFERMSGREKREHSSEPLVVFGLAKKASLDMRLIDPSAPDEVGSKMGVAVARVKEIHGTSRDVLGTQLVFADSFQSAPSQSKWLDEQETIPNPAFGKAEFNLYREFKRKLVAEGVPSGEVEIVADHDSDARREALFKKVNDGKVRVLLGSTEKMGVGVNVQQRLVALHHLDAPLRPMDVEQRNGRIVRQGNQNAEVEILTYGVENTLDAAIFQKLATKQKFINQVLRGELSGRNFEDAANEISLTFEEQMAAFSGDPLTVEKVALENQVRTLASLRDSHFRQVRAAEEELTGLQKRRLPELQSALVAQQRQARDFGERFAAEPVLGVGGRTLVDRDGIVDALNGLFASGLASAEAVLELNPSSQDYHHPLPSIELNGVPVSFTAVVPTDFKTGKRKQNAPAYVLWKFPGDHPRAVTSGAGFLASVRSKVEEISKRPANTAADIERAEKNVTELTGFVQQPFEREAELQQKQARLEEVAAELASRGREVAAAAARVDAALDLIDGGSAQAREALGRLQRGDAMGKVNMLGIQSALEIVRDLTIVGMDLVRRGYNGFAGWSKAMTTRFGNRIGSWLKETWERIQNIQAAKSLGLTPEGVGTVNRIEAQADASESPSPVQPVYDGKVDGFLQRLKRTSGRLAYFGSPKLLRAKQELDLTESYQAAAVREQSDRLLKMLMDDAFNARPLEFKLPKWMNTGAWADRLRRFKRLALPVAAHLNVTGKNPDGSFAFEDFTMRAGLMPKRQFAKGGHSVGDVVLVSNPLTGEMQELTIGSFVQTDGGREGYQLTRFMPAAQQAELYDYFRSEYPEFFWAVDIYIDPDLRDVRYESHGVSVPVFNRFALAAKMAEQNPGFSPVDAYTPDVLVTRSLLGAVRGALGLRRGTRSPGRKYKTGRARESGEVRDLFSGFNIRSFQALQEEARRKFVSAVVAEAVPIKGGVVPDGYVKLDTGIDEVWNAVKRLRGWQLPVDPVTGQRVFPETEARLQDDGGESFKAFFGEAAKLRGRQLMLPKPLVEMLARKYAAQRDHGRLYRLGAWLVRNSTQLFLAHPKTYVANVLTNDMFAMEAAYRNAVGGVLKLASGGRHVGERDLRTAGNILGGLVLHRFRGLRELLRIADGTQYLRTVREVLPDQVFADATQLADVKVRYDDKPFDLLRQGEIGGAVLQAIQYGNIDVRAKQRLAYAYLKANAVTTARASGFRGADLRKAVDSYMANPPVADRTRAVAAANFEMLNYADSPEWLNRFSRNDYGRLVLPFPRFGYHFLAKQAERLSALKLFLGKVPSGQRAEALADLVTVATFGLGGGGLALHALVRALFGGGEDDDEPREMFGVSSVKYVDEDGTVKTRALDRELVTSNRINLSYVFRSLGIDSEDDTDFWLRVRQYPAVVMAGAAVLAESDGRKFGVEHGVATYLQSVSDLGSDFFSLGMALKVPDKVLATLRSLETGRPEKPFLDPYATRVPLSAYLTEQAMDSFVPGSRQADEILYWLDPVARRKTESKELDFHPGAWHALRASHWTGVMDRVLTWMGNDETDLPAAGRVEMATLTLKATASPQERLRQIDANAALAEGGPNARLFLPPPVRGRPGTPRVAFVPESSREPIPALTRISSLLGLNLRPVPREDYREAVSGRNN